MEHLDELYLEEMQAIPRCDSRERERLLRQAAEGNHEASKRLIEGHLYLVAEIARDYEDRLTKEITMPELIQEGNMALTMAVYEFCMDMEEYPSESISSRFVGFINGQIVETMEAMLCEAEQDMQAAEQIAAKINLISEGARLLAEELGREATVEEIAKRLDMTEDEVYEGIKLAMNAMEQPEPEESNGFGEDTP